MAFGGNHQEKGTELYVLKHKDLDVALLRMDICSGLIDYVLAVYLPDELPVGCSEDGTHLA